MLKKSLSPRQTVAAVILIVVVVTVLVKLLLPGPDPTAVRPDDYQRMPTHPRPHQ